MRESESSGFNPSFTLPPPETAAGQLIEQYRYFIPSDKERHFFHNKFFAAWNGTIPSSIDRSAIDRLLEAYLGSIHHLRDVYGQKGKEESDRCRRYFHDLLTKMVFGKEFVRPKDKEEARRMIAESIDKIWEEAEKRHIVYN